MANIYNKTAVDLEIAKDRTINPIEASNIHALLKGRTKPRRPDSDFAYRIVWDSGRQRLTWHTMECAVGRTARRARRTVYTPENRRDAATACGSSTYATSYIDHMARCCTGKKSLPPENSPTFTARQASTIFRAAMDAGVAAGNAATPAPMCVGTPTRFLGNEIDTTKRTYYVPEGLCGFAWVLIRPGNSSLARHAAKVGIGRTAYGGGVSIPVHAHGQSMERKKVHAAAFAAVLRAHGVQASSESRLD